MSGLMHILSISSREVENEIERKIGRNFSLWTFISWIAVGRENFIQL
jgi:hypothetical protein